MAKKEVELLEEIPVVSEAARVAVRRPRTPSDLVQRREALSAEVEKVVEVLTAETGLPRELVSGVVWTHAANLVKGANYAVALRDHLSDRMAKVQVAL